jgi:hypothetical protein
MQGSPAFAWDGAEQVEAAGSYRGRVSRLESPGSNLGRGAVNLTSIRESDEGWYECKVFFPNRNPPTRPNGTWFHLTVEGMNTFMLTFYDVCIMLKQTNLFVLIYIPYYYLTFD